MNFENVTSDICFPFQSLFPLQFHIAKLGHFIVHWSGALVRFQELADFGQLFKAFNKCNQISMLIDKFRCQKTMTIKHLIHVEIRT